MPMNCLIGSTHPGGIANQPADRYRLRNASSLFSRTIV
jgi:hypothetical protein